MGRIYINKRWKFATEFSEQIFESEYNGEVLEEVRLPHTCKEVPYNYFDENEYQMICAYRRELFAPMEWENKEVLLTFEGIAHSAEVYLNGVKLNEHHCGYTGFTTNLSENLFLGENNIIVVKVDSREQQNIPPFGFVVDYMTFGGIYRDAYIEIKEKKYISDVFTKCLFPKNVEWPLESELEKFRTDIKVISECKIEGGKLEGLKLKTYIYRNDKKQLLSVKEIKNEIVRIENKISAVKLWDIESPNMYKLEFELVEGEKVLDTYILNKGFRLAKFKNDGFYLNGRKVKIRGLNRHQSYAYIGYAMPESMQKYDADILKNKLGCNAVRTSHYPQSHYFIDRCDEIGLLVFMEFPGWQYIGDEDWKKQALVNEEEMILQYRNHTSIILWGVRINESIDDDEFYIKTNKLAHELDPTRQTGGVRAHKKSNMYEDVYTYNDFSHDGKNEGCESKKNITSRVDKPYLITEYNGHMFPTKIYDNEEHRLEHALRHARVLDSVSFYEDIAGCFGWCMFDYNTHKDFGSGDRICYHGVMDMFRNPKLASLIYSCEADKELVLELSSSMDIGEHPACNRGFTYIISNADSVKMYKNDVFIKEYNAEDSKYKNLKHGPIIIDDFIGNQLVENENISKKTAKEITKALNHIALHGYGSYNFSILKTILKCVTVYRMKFSEAIVLYNKYIGDWGGSSTVYKFEAIKDGKVAKTIVKEPMKNIYFDITTSSKKLVEKITYDVAEIHIKAVDDNQNQMFFFNGPIKISTSGPIEIIGPDLISFNGGMTGVYVKSIGEPGNAIVKLENLQLGVSQIEFKVEVEP